MPFPNRGGGGAPVTITGGRGVGAVATAVPASGWTFTTGQWYNDGVAISGATALTYTRLVGDIGKVLSFVPTGLPYRAIAGATLAAVPGAPTIGTLTAGNTAVSAAFTAPGNNGGSAITKYGVYTYLASDNSLVGYIEGAASPIQQTGLTNGVAYYAKVTAWNSTGEGPQSAASNTATPSAQTILTQAQSPYTLTTADNGKSFLVQPTADFVINYPTGLGATFACDVAQDAAYPYPVSIVEVGTTGFNTNGLRIKSSATQAEGLGSYMIRGPGKSVNIAATAANVFTLSGAVARPQAVADKTGWPDAYNGSNFQVFGESVHNLKGGKVGDNIVMLKFVYTNSYSFQETAAANTLTFKAALEYPIGASTAPQAINFQGARTASTTGGVKTIVESDWVVPSAPIPITATPQQFVVRTFQRAPSGGVLYHKGQGRDERCFSSPTDGTNLDYTDTLRSALPAVGLGLNGTGFGGPQCFRPTAIIGITDTGAIVGMGDSRSMPANDYPTPGSLTRCAGELERAYGRRGVVLNLAASGDSVGSFWGSAANSDSVTGRLRRSLFKYGGHAASMYNVNDLNGGTAAQIDQGMIYLKASPTMVGRKLFGTTIPPSLVYSSDRLLTVAGQFQSNATNNQRRIDLNNNRRNGLPAGLYDGYVEVADIVESSRDSGFLKPSSVAQKITDATMAVGSNLINSPSGPFTPAHTGHYISGDWGAQQHTNTAQGGSSTTIQFAAAAPSQAGANIYQSQTVYITSGTGAGQSNVIQSYDNTTKIATMVAPWTTAPDATSVYALYIPATAVMNYVSATQVSVVTVLGNAAFNAVNPNLATASTFYIGAYETMVDPLLSNHESALTGLIIEQNANPPVIPAVGPIN